LEIEADEGGVGGARISEVKAVLVAEVWREEHVEIRGVEGHPRIVLGHVALAAELLGGEARPGRGAVRLRLAQRDVAEGVLPNVVDADVDELREAVALLLEGDRGGEERGARLVPEREGERARAAGVGVELAVVAVAGRDGGKDDGDVGEREVYDGVALEVERGALRWPEADAHDAEVKATWRAGTDREGSGVGGEGARVGRKRRVEQEDDSS